MDKNTNRRRAGLTRVDIFALLVVALVLTIGILVILPVFGRRRAAERRLHNCMSNLKTIGQSLNLYRNDNNGFFPFSWGPAGDAPGAFNNAAANSLGLLYPEYVVSARAFRCPSVEDVPVFGPSIGGRERTWMLLDSSYGYDPRILRGGDWYGAIMADMDGTFGIYGRDTCTVNHALGQNVLYVDVHVGWVDNNFCSANPKDNIFVQDPWDADTDTYLVRGDLNDLTISYDGYDHLHSTDGH